MSGSWFFFLGYQWANIWDETSAGGILLGKLLWIRANSHFSAAATARNTKKSPTQIVQDQHFERVFWMSEDRRRQISMNGSGIFPRMSVTRYLGWDVCWTNVQYSKLRVIQIHWDIKIIQITRKLGLRGEKCIGFGQFDQKICSDYAIIRIRRSLLYWKFYHGFVRILSFILPTVQPNTHSRM